MAAVNNAHQDDNRFPSMLGVVGSLGTADTLGTAKTLSPGIDPVTGAMFVNILAGAGAASNPTNGTLSTLGTVGTILGIGGTVTVTGASAGTFVNVSAGTQQTLGTVGVVNNIVTGNIAAVTSVTNLVSGTLLNSGSTTGVGVVTSVSEVVKGTTTLVTRTGNVGTLELGSVVVTTLPSGGTILNLANGTLASVTAVTTVSNLTNGSVNILTGTVTSVTNLAGGTIKKDMTPVIPGTPTHVRGTTGVAVWGTILPTTGNGIKQYTSGVSIVVVAGTVDVAVTNIGIGGSTGAGVLERGQFPAGGGIRSLYNPVMVSGTGGTIAYWLGGAGTVDIKVDGWTGA